MKGSSLSCNLRDGAPVELDGSVVSEALRLRVNEGGARAAVGDEAIDIWSESGWGRDGRGGDIAVNPSF
jgi:hypothetical protein